MAVLLSTQNIYYPRHMFWLRNKKIIFQYALLSGSLMCENKVESSQPFMSCYLNEICHYSFVSILFDMVLTVSD